MNVLTKFRKVILGLGLIGLAMYQLSQGEFNLALTSFVAGLVALEVVQNVAAKR